MTCPACLRSVQPTERGFIRLHRDKTHRVCVASGLPTYITEEVPCETPD